LADAILQSARLTITDWEPWENLDLAKVWEPLQYKMKM